LPVLMADHPVDFLINIFLGAIFVFKSHYSKVIFFY